MAPGLVVAIQTHGELLHWHYGWCSNKARGLRRKAAAPLLPSPRCGRGVGGEGLVEEAANDAAAPSTPARASQTWAVLIKRVYESDPLGCPECGGRMQVIAFIEPPQAAVIEKILRHCGLWCPAAPRAPPAGDLRVHAPDGDGESDFASDEPREVTFVDEATFWSTF